MINSIDNLIVRIDELTNEVNSLISMAEELEKENSALKIENAELKRRLGMNSTNSSKPPSTDGFKRPARRKNASELNDKVPGKKRGRKKGHKGDYLVANLEYPDKVEQCLPVECNLCPNRKMCCDKAKVADRRYVVDICVKTNITEFDALEMSCPIHKVLSSPQFPDNVKSHVQYGENIYTFVSSLSTIGAMSAQRIHDIFSYTFDVQLSPATVLNMVAKSAEAVQPALDLSLAALQNSPVVNFDETGLNVNGRLQWVHSSSDDFNTRLTLSKKRGQEGISANGVLPNSSCIAVHDCWAPYWNYTDNIHAICGAHLIRDLNGVSENCPNQSWSSEIKKLLLDMKKMKEEKIEAGAYSFSIDEIRTFEERYFKIIYDAFEENKWDPYKRSKKEKCKIPKARSLLRRLLKYKDEVFRFIYNFAVPFTNNAAERSVRPCKVKIKVSGVFRTDDGARNYLDVMSYFDTARKRGYNPFESLKNAIMGNPCAIFA